MHRSAALISLMSLVLLLAGCGSIFLPAVTGFMDRNLSGEIINRPYSFVSGVAVEVGEDWSVRLYQVSPDPSLDPWETGAYANPYPYLAFPIPQDSTATTYEVSTFGIDGIWLSGWINATSGASFDAGQIEILSIDTTAGILTGRLWAYTGEGTSSAAGDFTATIQN